MKLKSKKFLAGLGVVLVVALIIVGNVTRKSEKALSVQIAKVTAGNITSTVRAPGTIRSEKEVEISSSVPGQVVRLAVREGDRVTRGQLLLQLDRTEYAAQVEQGKAAVESSRANLRLAEASFEQARSIHERKKVLFDRTLASTEELEAARTQLALQRAEAESARQRIWEAEAALKIAEDRLGKTTFLAAQSGVVTDLNVEEGENVVIGTMNVPGTVIMTVADLAHMQVECGVDETDVVKVERGQKARVYVDAFPDTVFEAVVVEIGGSGKSGITGGEMSATDFDVKLAVKPGTQGLKPGMTADAEIETATHRNVLTVPIQAVAVRDKKTVEKWASKKDEAAKKGSKASGRKNDKKKDRAGSEGHDKDRDTSKAGAKIGKRDDDVEAKSVTSAGSADTTGGGDTTRVLGKGRRGEDELTGVFIVEGGKARFVQVRTGIMSETDVEVTSGLSGEDRVVTGPFRVLRDLKDGQSVKEETKAKEKKGGREKRED